MRRVRWACGFAFLQLALRASCGWSQIPDTFRNLQVLPKTISKPELVDTMRGFTRALGVRCDYCHVADTSTEPPTHDFDSDDKPMKQTARLMILMTRDLNEKYLSRVQSERPERLQVSCVTCHHGQTLPRTIDQVFADALTSKGVEAAVQEYRGLRDKYYGGAAYDFTERPLDELVRRLTGEGRSVEAQRVLDLAAEYNPRSSTVPFLRGELLLKGGDKTKALEQYRKALELDPSYEPAKRRLGELEGGGKPDSQPERPKPGDKPVKG